MASPIEYDTFIILVNSSPEDYTVEEIESLLLAQETRITKHFRSLDSNQASTNLVVHENLKERYTKVELKFKCLSSSS